MFKVTDTPAELMEAYDQFDLESAQIHMIFGEINEESARAACEFIYKSNLICPPDKVLTLVLNSIGGECTHGFAIIDAMQFSKLPIVVIGTGAIMSMATLILCAGTKGLRFITENTAVMAHQYIGGFEGKHHEIEAIYKNGVQLKEQMRGHFKKHSKVTDKIFDQELFGPTDTYITPERLVTIGMVDSVVTDVASLQAIMTKKRLAAAFASKA